MQEVIVIFDNLEQPHQNGIIGLKEKVKVLCRSDELPQIEETGLRARKAGEEFRKMFKR